MLCPRCARAVRKRLQSPSKHPQNEATLKNPRSAQPLPYHRTTCKTQHDSCCSHQPEQSLIVSSTPTKVGWDRTRGTLNHSDLIACAHLDAINATCPVTLVTHGRLLRVRFVGTPGLLTLLQCARGLHILRFVQLEVGSGLNGGRHSDVCSVLNSSMCPSECRWQSLGMMGCIRQSMELLRVCLQKCCPGRSRPNRFCDAKGLGTVLHEARAVLYQPRWPGGCFASGSGVVRNECGVYCWGAHGTQRDAPPPPLPVTH